MKALFVIAPFLLIIALFFAYQYHQAGKLLEIIQGEWEGEDVEFDPVTITVDKNRVSIDILEWKREFRVASIHQEDGDIIVYPEKDGEMIFSPKEGGYSVDFVTSEGGNRYFVRKKE